MLRIMLRMRTRTSVRMRLPLLFGVTLLQIACALSAVEEAAKETHFRESNRVVVVVGLRL